ncbi:hypothetical protein C2G38_2201794 [Gigaspora rosea]|uniref:BTB domain-containing protein n=1 Tax=Gigaspora rosea TaxID=44941 RepID=A0A397UP55_9GLOM|nr:hypothetical protein C2G38_2201794 [Gigaspora rosea]
MVLKFLEKLSDNYLELLDDKEDYNTVINVGESPNTKVFQAHSAILRYRSLHFRNELANVSKDKNHIKTLYLKNISIQHFEIIIRYIYGGVVLLDNHNSSFKFELMFIAYELLFDELAKHLETHLIETEAHWLRLNFTRIYQKIFQNDKLQELQKWCNDVVVKHPNKVFESQDFSSLQENALVSLICRDDLQMKEVKIWNHIIKWGIDQNPGLPTNPENWSSENFLALKTTLRNCLPHIRYFQISGDDIIDNVRPYKKILEKNLWKDITDKLISPNRQVSSIILPPRIISTPKLPNRNTEPFSAVINESHAAEIASWDGFTADSFWKLCNKQKHLVVVIKVKGTDEILGGYNYVGWDYPTSLYKNCNDSFIFSLKNCAIQNSILSRVIKPEHAIKCLDNFGPLFSGGCDLLMSNNSNQDRKCFCYPYSYEKRIRNDSTFESDGWSYFSAEEYEIFQIIEKDEHKAFIYYQKSANIGKANGTFQVGCCYENGIGVEKDEYKAYIYYQKSAEMGNANGHFNDTSGTFNDEYCYHYGIGVEKDEHKAFNYSQKSAEVGYSGGTFALGNCYEDGIGVEKDEQKAFIYYQKYAEMGLASGAFNVGNCYLYGTGIEKDEHKAFIYYQKSAEMGEVSGMSGATECYRNRIGITRDLNKANYWYHR